MPSIEKVYRPFSQPAVLAGAEKARYAEAQERFVRFFEEFLMEEKSPTAEMQSVFARIRQ
ncbi:MAG: hypothetical protein SOY64_04125 [Pyramidobacter sp.]|uniref:hypothetical protein n=1 Tax=Pyramidobacter sp. TaxID=1943581 RepID=UPI002A7F1278|nr:hypothetical protein [Pyramidobacter sp.]MDY4032244.1 hypothetical protein [Pyramidobacter sp.]